MDLFKILYPIEWVVAWIMNLWHEAFTFLGFKDGPGAAWVFSIVGLVITIRVLLIPLFVKQIKASRGMQLLQPEMQAIQKKYKGKTDPASREAMSRETMELYRKHGTNPFASCMPMLLQSPIFFALFRVLNSLLKIANGTVDPIGPIDAHVAGNIEKSTVFGAQLSDIFLKTDTTQTKIVIGLMIIAMCATTFTTQRQLTMKNMPPAALEGPMAQTQKMMLYVFPFIFAVSGVNFPVGVLVYWVTTNLWTMGQQFYTIRRMPAPGSEAERLMKARQARKRGGVAAAEVIEVAPEEPKGQRVQPVRKQRQKGAAKPPVKGSGSAGTGAGDPSGSGTGGSGDAPQSGAADAGTGSSAAGTDDSGASNRKPQSKSGKRKPRS